MPPPAARQQQEPSHAVVPSKPRRFAPFHTRPGRRPRQWCPRLLGPPGPRRCRRPQGTPGKDGVPTPVRLLDDKVGRWLPENRTRINGMISSLGLASPTFDPKNRPVAVFDWAQTVGTTTGLAYHVQVYEEMVDLIETLQDNGFDVWVATASPQFVIDAVSEELTGIKPNRVIGIRNLTDAQGRVTAHFQGCGTVADGADTLITYDQGKRCWINKLIFRQPAERQLTRQTDAHARQVFAAGDSDTDLAFVQDATHLKLAINRNKVQLMCNAYANHQGTWLVQPMFVQPRTQQTASYPCTTALDAAGQPITDELGHRFSQNYADSVYALP